MGGGIVGYKWGSFGRLGVSKVLEGSDDGDSFLSIEEESSSFSLGGGSGNTSKCFAENMDGTIGLEFWRSGSGEVAKEVVAGAAATCVGQDKISCIGNNVQYHIASIIAYEGIGVGSQVIKKEITGLAQ